MLKIEILDDKKTSNGIIIDLNLRLMGTAHFLTKSYRDNVLTESKKYTPVITGYLKSNFKASAITKRSNMYISKVFNNVRYAEYVEHGKEGQRGVQETEKDILRNYLKRSAYIIHNGGGMMPSERVAYGRKMLFKGSLKAIEKVEEIIKGWGV